MTEKPSSLGKRFAAIAQPYFFPDIRFGGWMTVILLILQLVFVAGVLFFIVSGTALAVNRLSPALIEKTAQGLYELIFRAFHSRLWLVPAMAVTVPVMVFAGLRRHILPRAGAWLLLGTVLFLSLSVTGINVAFSYIGNYFSNALVAKDQGLSYHFIYVYFCGFLVGIPILALYKYGQDVLSLRWRQWLTHEFLGKYFNHRNYYRIESEGLIDNPDQRIMEDIRSFTSTSLDFLLILLGSLMDLIAFSGILWSKSRTLTSSVILYSLVGTVMTILIGRRLVRLNFNQLRYEADFRYSLVHVRDNAESIAFYQGETSEKREIGTWFSKVLSNFNLLIGWQRNLSFFTTAHSYLPVVLPYLILFPKYFSGKIDYGDLLQANFAFAQVYAALAQIISRFDQITSFTAGVDRLAAFSEALKPVDALDQAERKDITSVTGDRFSLENITLVTPDRMRTLFRNMTVSPSPSDNLLIAGPSGVGKSSLLRAIAGLWTSGEGRVTRPDPGDILFLPQKPYMPIGSLRDQLCYPRSPKDMTDQDLLSVVESVNLKDLPDRLGGFETVLDWADVLSLGEQQRLSFARLLVSRPRFAILDEATSALDAHNEALVYSLLKTLGIHFISVGHRPGIVDFHTHVLELRPDGNWSLMTVSDYKTRAA